MKRWSANEREQLRGLFEQGLNNEAIAQIIDRSYASVEAQLRQMGLRRTNRWTLSELNYLRELVGDRPHKSLLRNYNAWAVKNGYPKRAASNIWVKANRLGMSRKLDSADWYTAAQIAEVIGCSHSTVREWIKSHRDFLKPTAAANHPTGIYAVSRSRLKAFLIKYPEIIERYRRTIDLIWLIDLLGGTP